AKACASVGEVDISEGKITSHTNPALDEANKYFLDYLYLHHPLTDPEIAKAGSTHAEELKKLTDDYNRELEFQQMDAKAAAILENVKVGAQISDYFVRLSKATLHEPGSYFTTEGPLKGWNG